MNKFDIIVATDRDNTIGMNGKLPWHSREELKLFKELTMNSILVMGRKTVENLPYLRGREIWCLTRDESLVDIDHKNEVKIFHRVEDILSKSCDKKIFIAGGESIYSLFLNEYESYIEKIYLTKFLDRYSGDSFFSIPFPERWIIVEKKESPEFNRFILKKNFKNESDYLSLLREIIKKGNIRHGRNGETKSLFGRKLIFDLRQGFPLFTTRKMFWRGIVEELLFFLRGDTNTKILEEKKIGIWKGNTNKDFLKKIGSDLKEGDMGPMYGWQWRRYGEEYNSSNEKGFDQLEYVIKTIKSDPTSRRIVMTTYNPKQADQGVLYPCHGLFVQFYIDNDYIDCMSVSRSGDMFHGIPFNIASYSLLLILIGKITGYKPRYLHFTIGDAHVYKDHYTCVENQLKRIPYTLPTLDINTEIESLSDLERLKTSNIILKNYNYHSNIKASMVV